MRPIHGVHDPFLDDVHQECLNIKSLAFEYKSLAFLYTVSTTAVAKRESIMYVCSFRNGTNMIEFAPLPLRS